MPSNYTPLETLEMLLGHLGFVFEIVEENRPIGPTLHIITRDPGRLIGRNGKTIDDIQFLLNRLISNPDDDSQRYFVDVENYRQHQLDEFMERVEHSASRVRSSGEEVILPPMNSFDRRIVHNTFKDDPEIESYSPPEKSRLKRIRLRPRKK